MHGKGLCLNVKLVAVMMIETYGKSHNCLMRVVSERLPEQHKYFFLFLLAIPPLLLLLL